MTDAADQREERRRMQALVSDIAEIRQQVGEQQRRLAALETHLRQMRLESQARYAESHRVDL